MNIQLVDMNTIEQQAQQLANAHLALGIFSTIILLAILALSFITIVRLSPVSVKVWIVKQLCSLINFSGYIAYNKPE
jgi:hypothetical protein